MARLAHVNFMHARKKELFLLLLGAVALSCLYPARLLDTTVGVVARRMASFHHHTRNRTNTESVTPPVPTDPSGPSGTRVPLIAADKQISLRTMFQASPALGCMSSSSRSLGGTEHTRQGNTLLSALAEKKLLSFLPADPKLMYSNTCEPYTPPRTKKLILNLNRQWWWFIGDRNYENLTRGCTYDACTMTDDVSLLPQADAVLVYICVQNRKTPPPRASHKQIWVAFCMESPVHYRGYFNSSAWRGPVFNWTMNYRVDSDVFYPYSFLSLRPDPLAPSTKDFKAIVKQKHKPVAWFVSNCNDKSGRMRYVKQLQRHIDVDVYGACGDKKCAKADDVSCLALMNTTYFFYLAFENSLCRDYVTEKLFKLYLNVDAVPVVLGAANYSRYFPPGTFLDTANYPSPRALAQHLKVLMADTEAYARMLERKDRFRLMGDGHNVCELCRRLHNPGPPKMYPDIMKWVMKDACHDPAYLKAGRS